MGLTGRDIVCFSTHYWDERWFRKQEFMSRFTRSNRVLFVEPSFSMARSPEDHLRDVATNRHLVPTVELRGENLYVFKPPRGLLKWTYPRIERLTYAWYARLIARAMSRLGFHDAVLWIYRPSYAHVLDAIPHRHVVFDLVDDLTAYEVEDSARAGYIEGSVSSLAARSDLLIVTAKTLAERYGPGARRVVHIPNGFDAELFAPERGELGTPAPLRGVPRPILGLVGTLFNFLDFDLLDQVARIHFDKSIVLVGPVEESAASAVRRLLRLPNVRYLGARPKTEIPAYIAAFDLCLNPFKTGRAADSVNPLKVYEYLAMGKAVVSTRMAALEREEAGVAVLFAENAAEFAAHIASSLSADQPRQSDARRKAAEPYSWERLFERVNTACTEVLG